MRMKKKKGWMSHVVCLAFVMFISCVFVFSIKTDAKTKYKLGMYLNSKGTKMVTIGSQWDSGKRHTVYTSRRGDPHHMDSYDVEFKGGKVVMKAGGKIIFTISYKKGGKKIVFKGRTRETKWLNGVYKYKRNPW